MMALHRSNAKKMRERERERERAELDKPKGAPSCARGRSKGFTPSALSFFFFLVRSKETWASRTGRETNGEKAELGRSCGVVAETQEDLITLPSAGSLEGKGGD